MKNEKNKNHKKKEISSTCQKYEQQNGNTAEYEKVAH